MFAVLKTGGKQYKVQSGDMLRVEKIAADAGEKVQFNEILMLGGDAPVIGSPLVDGAAVQAEVVDQVKGDKVIHFVKRRRKHGSQRTKGHRQQLTLLRVTEILEKGADKSGVKAAVGAGALAAGMGKERYADNATDQAEMAKQVKNNEAGEKSVAKKAEPKAEKKAEPKKEAPAAADDLTAITGIGPAAAKKLNEAGITTYAELAKVDADNFEAVKVKPEWIEQAKELAK
ncbi:50S ribosomal protein L21 [Roseovarius indicus]|uniref:Large ribosomal subunit protein bL21 n=1 Tax=Roseovarius indicus TaxID=540747 RepID=A0A0T5PAB7_9RHOB|nr:50S ribosomal protein L21 [Roseovarius indicus]KRS18182.1 50S ribosomal protein L21 [Roseovarius indicus]QEW26988.1 50S ribosomal protein L21 [Roseovarius indicus]SFD56414.1 LSU ribosomal protein L21P [Roseovarius indicus]